MIDKKANSDFMEDEDSLVDYDADAYKNKKVKPMTNKQHSEMIKQRDGLTGTRRKTPSWMKCCIPETGCTAKCSQLGDVSDGLS